LRDPKNNNIKELLAKYRIRLNRDLGQHFLIDNNILDRIVSAGNVTKDDLVIEIGTGIGSLTRHIAKRAGHVITIEMDDKLIQPAKEYLEGLTNVEIINNDAMKVDFEEIFNKYPQYKHKKIIANVPYYITSPIIAKIIEADIKPDLIIFTIQKEVARRISSPPGNKVYGSFTIFVNFYTKPKIVFEIGKRAFLPSPEVDSSVIRLDVLSKPPVDVKDQKLFFKIVHAAFIQRRKMLRNALINANISGTTADSIDNALKDSGIDGKRRGETLSIQEFAELANFL
jgi:16S rRNA (adenine1518-N6/adenine1519-N6)-dimethyltransferase